ncbi:MAG: ferritin [Dissulfurimicrobium sp.]|uniref:ferritin n=1 Tax=Dissulfurimicrobium sp. TaxID=2022436 RepID=UPI00404B8E90
MIDKKMEEAINEQINSEFYSAYLYLSMASYFESVDLMGCAQWMKAQVQEELMHAMKMYDFIVGRGGRVMLEAIKGPKTDWNSAMEVFEDGLKHEQMVTDRINNLIELATSKKDHATHIFLQWFIIEQVEEEASFNAVIQKLKLAGNSPGAMFMIDRELGTRTFQPTSPAKQEAAKQV